MPAPALDLAPVRTAIKNKVAGVAAIGQVHDYERFANKQSDLAALYESAAQTGNRIVGWFVSLRSKSERAIEYGSRWEAEAVWSIVGYMSLDDADATEKKMSALADKIADAFRDDDTLGGAVMSCINDAAGNEAGAQLEALEHVLFCGVLCHRARMRLFTRILF